MTNKTKIIEIDRSLCIKLYIKHEVIWSRPSKAPLMRAVASFCPSRTCLFVEESLELLDLFVQELLRLLDLFLQGIHGHKSLRPHKLLIQYALDPNIPGAYVSVLVVLVLNLIVKPNQINRTQDPERLKENLA